MKTIKAKAIAMKEFVVEFKTELALIVGGTALAVVAVIVRSALNEANENLKDPAIHAAWGTILNR